MATPTYPAGYGNDTDTMAEVRTKHQARYHPEVWRRIEAAMVAAQGLLGLAPDQGLCGVGGGARTREEQAASYARDPNTFAPPGSSFHEVWTTWADGKKGATAVDWVGRNGRHQEAWKWLRDHGGLYGLKTFWNVNGEPWHSQPVELPNSVSQWKALGYPAPRVWDLPGTVPAPPPPPPPDPHTPVDFGLWPYNRSKPTIREGSLGDAVRYAQLVCRHRAGQQLSVDGEFGPATDRAVRNVQAYVMGPEHADGVVGPLTWEVLDALAGYTPPPPEPDVPGGVVDRPQGAYYVRVGDSPWAAAQRVYGTGSVWQQYFTQAQFDSGDDVGKRIACPDRPGRECTVQPGDGPYALMGRCYPEANRYAAGWLDRFYVFNGGQQRTLRPGDLVFVEQPS